MKLLYKITGDDHRLIMNCPPAEQKRFQWMGIFVILIFFLCGFSVYHAFGELFRNRLIAISMGVFFALMIFNIYLLLLYTLSRNPFPVSVSNRGIYFSRGIRIGFICFIAIVVSKPLETVLWGAMLERDIAHFKTEKVAQYVQLTREYFERENAGILEMIADEYSLGGNPDTSRISYLNLLLEKRLAEKERMITAMEKLVNRSNYFIQSIIIVSTQYPISWVITCIIILIFLIPTLLKLSMGEHYTFYRLKKDMDYQLVISEYKLFKERYEHLITSRFGNKYELSECYLDPPFNTIRKTDQRQFQPEAALLAHIYNAGAVD